MNIYVFEYDESWGKGVEIIRAASEGEAWKTFERVVGSADFARVTLLDLNVVGLLYSSDF